MKKQIWVSGIGIVCPIGSNIKEFSEGLLQGREGFHEITDFKPRKGKDKAALVMNYRPDDPGRAIKMLRRAVKEALKDAGLPNDIRQNAALVMATMAGDSRQAEQVWGGLKRDGNLKEREKINSIIKYPNSSLLDALAVTYEIQGPRTVVSNACASGNIAVGYGISLLQAGKADAVIVCGLEVLKESMYWGMHGLRIMSSELKAFDANRKGTVLGEGAGVLVLETADSILARKGRSWGEIAGYGNRSDPQSDSIIPNEDGAGLAAAMNQAIASSGIKSENIDYLNAYGTGTKVSDLTETKAIKRLFGECSSRLPVSSSKTFLGNSGAASGVLEAITTLVAMREGFIPPTLHWDTRDKELDLDYVPAKGRPGRVRYALSNSIGGGGVNTSIVLKTISRQTDSYFPGRDKNPRGSTPEKDDIVITGIGTVSAYGNDRVAFKNNIQRFCETDFFNTKGPCLRDMTKLLDSQFQRANMAAKFLLAAAQGAVEESRLSDFGREEVGIVVGTAFGGYTSTAAELCRTILNPGPNFITPYILTNNGANLGATLLCRSYGISGYNATLTTGNTAGLDAIIHAVDVLHNENELKAVLVGGADILDSSLEQAYKYLKDKTGIECCPGEGSGVFVLERKSSALKRGANIFGTIKRCEQGSFTAGRGNSPTPAEIRSRLKISPADGNRPGILFCHLPFTFPGGDTAKHKIMKDIFNEAHIINLPSLFGEAHAATGILGLAAALMTDMKCFSDGRKIKDDLRGMFTLAPGGNYSYLELVRDLP